MWTILDNQVFWKNAEVGDFLTKVLNLFLKDAKTFSYAFLLISIGNIVFKGKQTKTRSQGKEFSGKEVTITLPDVLFNIGRKADDHRRLKSSFLAKLCNLLRTISFSDSFLRKVSRILFKNSPSKSPLPNKKIITYLGDGKVTLLISICNGIWLDMNVKTLFREVMERSKKAISPSMS